MECKVSGVGGGKNVLKSNVCRGNRKWTTKENHEPCQTSRRREDTATSLLGHEQVRDSHVHLDPNMGMEKGSDEEDSNEEGRRDDMADWSRHEPARNGAYRGQARR